LPTYATENLTNHLNIHNTFGVGLAGIPTF
jgi:hypothetical protein